MQGHLGKLKADTWHWREMESPGHLNLWAKQKYKMQWVHHLQAKPQGPSLDLQAKLGLYGMLCQTTSLTTKS